MTQPLPTVPVLCSRALALIFLLLLHHLALVLVLDCRVILLWKISLVQYGPRSKKWYQTYTTITKQPLSLHLLVWLDFLSLLVFGVALDAFASNAVVAVQNTQVTDLYPQQNSQNQKNPLSSLAANPLSSNKNNTMTTARQVILCHDKNMLTQIIQFLDVKSRLTSALTNKLFASNRLLDLSDIKEGLEYDGKSLIQRKHNQHICRMTNFLIIPEHIRNTCMTSCTLDLSVISDISRHSTLDAAFAEFVPPNINKLKLEIPSTIQNPEIIRFIYTIIKLRLSLCHLVLSSETIKSLFFILFFTIHSDEIFDRVTHIEINNLLFDDSLIRFLSVFKPSHFVFRRDELPRLPLNDVSQITAGFGCLSNIQHMYIDIPGEFEAICALFPRLVTYHGLIVIEDIANGAFLDSNIPFPYLEIFKAEIMPVVFGSSFMMTDARRFVQQVETEIRLKQFPSIKTVVMTIPVADIIHSETHCFSLHTSSITVRYVAGSTGDKVRARLNDLYHEYRKDVTNSL